MKNVNLCKSTNKDLELSVPKGVGPSTTLAWPGWKQPDIAVTVDRHDRKQSGSKKVV